MTQICAKFIASAVIVLHMRWIKGARRNKMIVDTRCSYRVFACVCVCENGMYVEQMHKHQSVQAKYMNILIHARESLCC